MAKKEVRVTVLPGHVVTSGGKHYAAGASFKAPAERAWKLHATQQVAEIHKDDLAVVMQALADRERRRVSGDEVVVNVGGEG